MEIYSHDIDRFPGLCPACAFHLYDQLFTISEHSWGVVWELFFPDRGENAITQIIWSHQTLEWSFPESFIWQTFTGHFLGARHSAGHGAEMAGGKKATGPGAQADQKHEWVQLPTFWLSAGWLVGGRLGEVGGVGGVGVPGLELGLWEGRAGIWEVFKEEVSGRGASRGEWNEPVKCLGSNPSYAKFVSETSNCLFNPFQLSSL